MFILLELTRGCFFWSFPTMEHKETLHVLKYIIRILVALAERPEAERDRTEHLGYIPIEETREPKPQSGKVESKTAAPSR